MNSPKPYPEDELDHLVRGALKAQVSDQDPPDHVWKRIKLELEADKAPPPRRFRVRWSPVVVQAALTLLLAMLGGVGLQTLLSPDGARYPTRAPSPSVTTVDVVEERLAPPALAMLDDRAELRSLKTLSKQNPVHQTDIEPASQPPVVIPRDAPPNIYSPEGRALMAELSWPPEVEGQNRLHSGPYRWFK